MKKIPLKNTEKDKKQKTVVEKTISLEMPYGENLIAISEPLPQIKDPRYKLDIPRFDSDKNKNDILVSEFPTPFRINDKFHIVPYIEGKEKHILTQTEIDFYLFKDIYYRIELQEISDFLDYQLELCLSKEVQKYMEAVEQKPYKNIIERLKVLNSIINDNSYFDRKKYFPTLPSEPLINKQELCKIWVNEKLKEIEKSNPARKTPTGFINILQPHQIEILNDWILKDYISMFTEIENELFDLGYIDNSYVWVKNKTKLVEFLCVLIEYKYFKPIVLGKKIKDFHKVQFISERYGLCKTGLSETWKKSKKRFDLAVIHFSWIKKP